MFLFSANLAHFLYITGKTAPLNDATVFRKTQLWYANFEAMNTVKSSVLPNRVCCFLSHIHS